LGEQVVKLVSVQEQGQWRPALLRDGMVVSIETAGGTAAEAIGAFMKDGKVREGAARPSDGVTLGLPVPQPGKIICIGLNYREHAKEGGNPIPDYPAVFLRATTSLVPHGAPLIVPAVSDKLDYEAELAVVIGARAHRIAQRDALSCVFGYSCFNDGSVRDYQRKSTQWTMGKNFDGTGGFGPHVVSADELPPGATGLGIRTRLNGTVMQDGTTSDMIFSIAELVAISSEVMTLEPGDVIITGTPSGVGYARKPPVFLKPGDTCDIEIDGIGTLRNGVAAA
jgi:2-keto-4-pentenoate hydratase/2-oxohepta-3-ene-1,7-dioic acid hydratase in catechol pathway